MDRHDYHQGSDTCCIRRAVVDGRGAGARRPAPRRRALPRRGARSRRRSWRRRVRPREVPVLPSLLLPSVLFVPAAREPRVRIVDGVPRAVPVLRRAVRLRAAVRRSVRLRCAGAELPVLELPVVELSVVELSVVELSVAELPVTELSVVELS